MLSGGEKREKQSEREERTESRLQAHALVIFLSSPSPQRERRRRWWFFVFVFSSLEGISFLKKQGIQVINGPCARTRRAYRRWGRQVVADAKEVVLCLGTRDDGETRRQHEKESRRGDTLPDSGASSLFTLHRHQLPASPFPSF